MGARYLLRDQLLRAWNKVIAGEYSDRLINSERGLQVFLCHHLIKEFEADKVKRQLFIEPRISAGIEDDEFRYPDIVICNTKQIIGVVELKYLPRTRPKYEKDLQTLDWMLMHSEELCVSNDRYQGDKDKAEVKRFELADDAVLCWAGVYASPKHDIKISEKDAFNKRLMVLHAITCKGKSPELFPGLT